MPHIFRLRKEPFSPFVIGVALLFLAVFLFLPDVVRAGFGVSPPDIIEDRLVPGSHFEETIFLIQGNPEEDVTVNVTLDSKDSKGWISFKEGKQFTIPAGVQQFPLHVVVDVPEDALLGIYRAIIRVNTVPQVAENAGEVAISLGGRIDVELTIGDDVVYEYSVKSIDIPDIEEDASPETRIRIDNTGNVPAKPAGVSFELFSKFGDIRLAFATLESDSFDTIPSFSEGVINLEFPIDVVIAIGEYWGHVKVYDEERQLVGELRTVFNVHERTTTLDGLVSGALMEKLPPNILPAAFLVVVLILLLIIFKKKLRTLFKRN